MKKQLFSISFVLCCLLSVFQLQAQDQQTTLRERIARRQSEQKTPNNSGQNLTLRTQIMNQSQTKDIQNAPWKREIYRFLDLEKEKNASLYFPVKPTGNRMNLFTLIFRNVLEGKIDVYEYQLDGSEDFSDKYKKKIEDILKSFEIMYIVENGKYLVEDVDIPNNEVLGYYVKETWYFDKNNSVMDVKTDAICPVLVRQDDFGAESTKYPMFWVPYENIRPYAAQMPIMVSSLNNATTQTINDFFTKHNFEGDIYKTTNVRNMSLAQMFPSDTLVEKEQKKIETQLKQFNDRLWVHNDSISIRKREELSNAKKSNKKTAKSISGSTDSSLVTETPDRATVQKEAKQQRRSAPARSMRNRKRN